MTTPELEKVCDKCNGEGRLRQGWDDEIIKCPFCDGFGTVLTEFGEAVLELIKKRLKVRGASWKLTDANE